MSVINQPMKVRIWEDTIELPTYEVGRPNKNPLFLEKRVYQASSGKIYPLAFTDKINDEKIMKAYKVIYMENAYLKVMLMPSMGGKIYRAIDKTNNYDFVYYNQVVKPALVGLTGPWVSGGIEFNWPQHHRPSTFAPVDYKIIDNGDGSMTCWMGEIDRMYGTKGMAGFTLYRDKAYIEIKGQLYNRTEMPQTFLWWANPAVAVNDYTQSIFPPDVHAVFDHGKRDVSKFPIATGTYYKMDYSSGVDISRYKNIPVPTSYMAYHSDYNFVGGYDFREEAGILHYANHHISPGKKQWTWGNGDFGQAWDRNLTDEDGPYIELMTGVFTDNQPDFTWLMPKEEKTFKQYFMPYKAVGEVKNANLDAMVNLTFSNGEAVIKLYTPRILRHITVTLLEDNKLVYQSGIEQLTPDCAFKTAVTLKDQKSHHLYRLVVTDHEGYEIIAYQEKEPEILETPSPATAPERPKDMATCEDLFLTGQHLEQYRHATYLPEDYYLEALKRNPDDLRNNCAYGLLMYRRGQYEVALKHMKLAVATSTKRNPNPYDSEPFYNLGLIYQRMNRKEEAYGTFYKSTWSDAWQANGFYNIACLDAGKGEHRLGLEHVEKSLNRNVRNIKARVLKSALLRLLGKKDLSLANLEQTLSIDPLSYGALYELYQNALAEGDTKAETTKARLVQTLRGDVQSYLELALDYMEYGLLEDAETILKMALEGKAVSEVYPMVYYVLAYIKAKTCDGEAVMVYLKGASEARSDYCFPHRLSEMLALEMAIRRNPEDSKAYYYLGNAYYDKKRYGEALELWASSVALNPDFATSNRNLALAYVNIQGDVEKGLTYLEKAYKCNTLDARVLFELDQLFKKAGRSHNDRRQYLAQHLELVEERDDLFVEYVTLLNNTGAYREAKSLMEGRTFHPWEGGEGKVIAQYKYCRIELAKEALLAGEYETAKVLLKECEFYPENLGEGKIQGTAENDVHYFLAMAYEGAGEVEEARAYYLKSSIGIEEPTDAMFYNDQPADMMFYRGLAYKKLGDLDLAKSCLNKIYDFGEKNIRNEVTIDYFAVSLPDFLVFEDDLNIKNKVHCLYLLGLACLGLGATMKGQQYLEEAMAMNISHQGVLKHLHLAPNFL